MFSNKEEFKQQYAERMIKMYGRSLESAHITEKYLVLGEMVREYAIEARKIAEEYSLPFVELQEKLNEAVKVYGAENCYYDGVHPSPVASKIISDEWLRVFKKEVIKE